MVQSLVVAVALQLKAIPTTSSTTRLSDQNSQNTSGGDINFENTGNLTSFGSASSGI